MSRPLFAIWLAESTGPELNASMYMGEAGIVKALSACPEYIQESKPCSLHSITLHHVGSPSGRMTFKSQNSLNSGQDLAKRRKDKRQSFNGWMPSSSQNVALRVQAEVFRKLHLVGHAAMHAVQAHMHKKGLAVRRQGNQAPPGW